MLRVVVDNKSKPGHKRPMGVDWRWVTREREKTFREILASNVRLNGQQALECLDTIAAMRDAIDTADAMCLEASERLARVTERRRRT